MPNRLHRRRRTSSCAPRLAHRGARRRGPRPRPRCSPTARRCVFRPRSRPAALGARASPARARPRAPRLRRRRRQRRPRALVGPASRAAGRAGPQRELLDLYPRLQHAGAAAVGRRGPPASARRRRGGARADRRAQLRVLPGTGYLIAYDDPVGVARELVRVLRIGFPGHPRDQGRRAMSQATPVRRRDRARRSRTSRSPASRCRSR